MSRFCMTRTEIYDYAAKVMDYLRIDKSKVKIDVYYNNNGGAVAQKGERIVIGGCHLRHGKAWAESVIIHELIHIYLHHLGYEKELHGRKFRRMEIFVLKKFGYVPKEYKKAYFVELYDLNGVLLFKKKNNGNWWFRKRGFNGKQIA